MFLFDIFALLKESVQAKIHKILIGLTSDEIKDDIKGKTNKIIVEAELHPQRERINAALHDREDEIKKRLGPSNEIWEEKRSFKQKVYQATSHKAKEADMTMDKTK